jgi:hypothetical protein
MRRRTSVEDESWGLMCQSHRKENGKLLKKKKEEKSTAIALYTSDKLIGLMITHSLVPAAVSAMDSMELTSESFMGVDAQRTPIKVGVVI